MQWNFNPWLNLTPKIKRNTTGVTCPSIFLPASVYGSNQETGNSIPEFKELINSFHEANISVILDVVYNHVGIPPHLLNLDRNLHFRTDEFGRLQNHSGCGNDLKCEAEPVKKLILDSLIYFVKTFDVDGFRFDLGELLGIELLREIEAELKKIKPRIILITEPWSFAVAYHWRSIKPAMHSGAIIAGENT